MCSQTRLFVGNLSENTNEDDLLDAFSKFGEVRNLDVKHKAAEESNKNNFAFVTLSSSNYEVESCIKHFSAQNFNGNKLYVTRARESFLERLQRERLQENSKQEEKKHNHLPKKNPVIKLGDKLTPRKRKLDYSIQQDDNKTKSKLNAKHVVHETPLPDGPNNGLESSKKINSDKKRMESMKQKRQEFKQKQQIIKTGLKAIDKLQNKKTRFSDSEEEHTLTHKNQNDSANHNEYKKTNLFDDADGSGDEVNFEIKKQFEGKKGQKVLDLQSRYKSDKRFVLDERFIEDDHSEGEYNEKQGVEDENIDVEQADEKSKQLNILQDVLGVSIRSSRDDSASNKKKLKMGMLRFDPTQPEHAKFLAPIEENQETLKKTKKKINKEKHNKEANSEVSLQEVPKVEVSKEQFYKVSETLKEAIAQPTTFSLRSLFANNEEEYKTEERIEQSEDYIPLKEPKDRKVRNPLEPGEKNPFVYDSSESDEEAEDNESKQKNALLEKNEVKAVWRENLFFTNSDKRFIEGLAFFNKTNEDIRPKERRELKSLMKKRIYNRERKNQMFQKKIGGRKKSMKKSYRNKS